MKKAILVLCLLMTTIGVTIAGGNKFKQDVFKTSIGKLTITFIGHGTLMMEINGVVIHVDPWSKLANYTTLPKADAILITHFHPDHLDTNAIDQITKLSTQIVEPPTVFDILHKGTVMKNGETHTILDMKVEAVPAYNTTEGRDKFHPKGRDNGYVLTIGDKRIYIAGDTENIPEMAALKNIDIAFLPMNQPYTMLPEQVAAAVKVFHPKILYPYHYGETDLSVLKKLLAEEKTIELRIRSMK
jgi:L-ascorbate metabolism protein UlaG (beta-lactamase superfamily)